MLSSRYQQSGAPIDDTREEYKTSSEPTTPSGKRFIINDKVNFTIRQHSRMKEILIVSINISN